MLYRLRKKGGRSAIPPTFKVGAKNRWGGLNLSPERGVSITARMGQRTNQDFSAVAVVDPEIMPFLTAEVRRQQNTLEMIASENHVSSAVLQAMGSIFTNKYAEGYPGKRY